MADPQSQTDDGSPPKKPSPGDSQEPAAKTPADDIVVFYCPSGHKLNAPARLQGKPGQCPDCGQKFRIPSYEEDQAEEAVEEVGEEELPAPPDAVEQKLAELEELDGFPEAHEELEEIQDEIVDIDVEADVEEVPLVDDIVGPVVAPLPVVGHALAQTFARLWDRRGEAGSVDLYLDEGELMSPEFFSPELSQTTHGVFADRMEDGTYCVISVPWERVKRAVLNKVEQLPTGLFR